MERRGDGAGQILYNFINLMNELYIFASRWLPRLRMTDEWCTCDLMLVRRLPATSCNAGKRLVRTPKVYVRESWLLHALLSLQINKNPKCQSNTISRMETS